MNVIVLCTGNSCRSQIAHAYLQSLNPKLNVYSAGTKPAGGVNTKAIQVMREKGFDLSSHTADHVDMYLDKDFDYVVTVCGNADQACPGFTGKVKKRVHIGFDDPADAIGTEEEIYATFRRVRDEIFCDFKKFYHENIAGEL